MELLQILFPYTHIYIHLRIYVPHRPDTSIRETSNRQESCLIVIHTVLKIREYDTSWTGSNSFAVYLYDIGPKLVKDYVALILKITT